VCTKHGRAFKNITFCQYHKYLTALLAFYVVEVNNYQIHRFEYTDERLPFRMIYYNNAYHLIYDTIGSLRRIADDAGTIIGEITYDSYGYVQSSKMPLESAFLGFAGGLYDPDTKLTRFGYRDYDAETGKWTAKDPIGFAGGDTNLYGYVLGDPVNFVDPTGRIGIARIAIVGIGILLNIDAILDWFGFFQESSENINNNSEIKTIEDYLDYKKNFNQQCEASFDIGKETTVDILSKGIPFSKKTTAVIGSVDEASR